MLNEEPTPGVESDVYEAPEVRTIGSLYENTLRNKVLGSPSDGDFLIGYGSLRSS